MRNSCSINGNSCLNLKKTRHMKKQYIIPEAEVVEIKINQLLMTSTMTLINSDDPDEQITGSGDFL